MRGTRTAGSAHVPPAPGANRSARRPRTPGGAHNDPEGGRCPCSFDTHGGLALAAAAAALRARARAGGRRGGRRARPGDDDRPDRDDERPLGGAGTGRRRVRRARHLHRDRDAVRHGRDAPVADDVHRPHRPGDGGAHPRRDPRQAGPGGRAALRSVHEPGERDCHRGRDGARRRSRRAARTSTSTPTRTRRARSAVRSASNAPVAQRAHLAAGGAEAEGQRQACRRHLRRHRHEGGNDRRRHLAADASRGCRVAPSLRTSTSAGRDGRGRSPSPSAVRAGAVSAGPGS